MSFALLREDVKWMSYAELKSNSHAVFPCLSDRENRILQRDVAQRIVEKERAFKCKKCSS